MHSRFSEPRRPRDGSGTARRRLVSRVTRRGFRRRQKDHALDGEPAQGGGAAQFVMQAIEPWGARSTTVAGRPGWLSAGSSIRPLSIGSPEIDSAPNRGWGRSGGRRWGSRDRPNHRRGRSAGVVESGGPAARSLDRRLHHDWQLILGYGAIAASRSTPGCASWPRALTLPLLAHLETLAGASHLVHCRSRSQLSQLSPTISVRSGGSNSLGSAL